MLRTGSHVKKELEYRVQSPTVRNHIQNATKQFDLFLKYQHDKTQNLGKDYLKKSLALFNEAINSSETPTDKAYSHRRYASAIIRDYSLSADDRFTIAKNHLLNAIEGFERNRCDDTIQMELQRSYASLGHAALELKDGETLNVCKDKLFELVKQIPNPEYEVETITFSYHLHFSKGELDKALEVLNVLKKKQPSPTHFRSLAKIHLFKLSNISADAKMEYFDNHVLANFWKSFDAHKATDSPLSANARHSALLKDFIALLHIKIIQQLNSIADIDSKIETPYQYIERQISRVYGRKSFEYLSALRTITNAINNIKNQGMITLGMDLFEEKPPHIAVSEKEFEDLFPDYDDFMAARNKNRVPNASLAPVSIFKEKNDSNIQEAEPLKTPSN